MTDRQKALLDKKLGEEYEGKGFNFWAVTVAVSYTHLTLPTKA